MSWMKRLIEHTGMPSAPCRLNKWNHLDRMEHGGAKRFDAGQIPTYIAAKFITYLIRMRITLGLCCNGDEVDRACA